MPGRSASAQIAAIQSRVIGKSAERAEHAGIGFSTAEAEAAGDGERHLVAAMGKQRATRPAVTLQHIECARILDDSVGLRRIDLDDVVALRTQTAEPNEIFHVLRRKQILAGRERSIVPAGDLREQRKIQWIARLLEPAQPNGASASA